ncbi:MAG: hypothetical protein DRQ39_04020 [Gammaproteobacteria bacterium]|nr:MAG: hypothetical protein DRQ39_04020 [Gammaproteobacteria bacterium]
MIDLYMYIAVFTFAALSALCMISGDGVDLEDFFYIVALTALWPTLIFIIYSIYKEETKITDTKEF